MSRHSKGPETEFFEKSELAQEKKQQAVKQSTKFKEDAITAANAPLGFCGIIAVLILVAVVVPSGLGVIALLA